MATDNKSLGRFVLDGIAPAPRGVPQVEVTFNIDANGILNVTAKDKGTGKEQSITIKDSGNMSKEDIEKAQKEAEEHAEEDAKKKEAVEAKNLLSSSIYAAEKMVADNGDKISDDDRKVVEDAVKEAKEAEKSDDKEELEKAFTALSEKIQPVGAKLYEDASAEAEKPDEKSENDEKNDGDEKEVVEGEVEDK